MGMVGPISAALMLIGQPTSAGASRAEAAYRWMAIGNPTSGFLMVIGNLTSVALKGIGELGSASPMALGQPRSGGCNGHWWADHWLTTREGVRLGCYP